MQLYAAPCEDQFAHKTQRNTGLYDLCDCLKGHTKHVRFSKSSLDSTPFSSGRWWPASPQPDIPQEGSLPDFGLPLLTTNPLDDHNSHDKSCSPVYSLVPVEVRVRGRSYRTTRQTTNRRVLAQSAELPHLNRNAMTVTKALATTSKLLPGYSPIWTPCARWSPARFASAFSQSLTHSPAAIHIATSA